MSISPAVRLFLGGFLTIFHLSALAFAIASFDHPIWLDPPIISARDASIILTAMSGVGVGLVLGSWEVVKEAPRVLVDKVERNVDGTWGRRP